VPRAASTHPFDVVLGLRLLQPSGTIAQLAEDVGVAPSQIHGALMRLRYAGLLRPDGRSVNARAFSEFVLFGVRYAFPAARRELALGIPTAYSAAELATEVDANDVLVWPAPNAKGAVRGFGLTPLYPRAIVLPEKSPETYRLLTFVDALRIGDPPVRAIARDHLEEAFGLRASTARDS
jgi:hypothetical protein